MKIKSDLIIFFVLFITCFFITYYFRISPNWDFYSYHYYNGWAILNDRLNIDLLPCLFRTYFNPYFDAIMYLILQGTENKPFLLFLIMVLKLSLLFFFGYKVTNTALLYTDKNHKIAILFCIVMGVLSPIIIMCNSIENTDIPSGILCLIALYMYSANIFYDSSPKKYISIIISLIILGIAVGLKYTNFSYIVAIFVSSLILIKNIKNPLKTFLISLAGFFIGFSITGLSWLYIVYDKFKNPFFPYFNHIFNSPFADKTIIFNTDFCHLKQNSIWKYIFMPLKNSLNEINIGIEYMYYDLKIILGFTVIIGLFLILNIKKIRENTKNIVNIKILYFLLYFTVFSYYINLFIFGNYRYVLVLFLMVPLFIYVCFSQIQNRKLLNCLLLLVLFLSYNNYVMPNNFKCGLPKSIIEIQNLNFEDNSIILCAGFLTAYIAPHQNEKVKYIGFTLPEEYIKNTYYIKKRSVFKNKFYANKFLEKTIEKEIQASEHLYIIFSEDSLGTNFHDFKLYEQAINKYSMGTYTEIKDCKYIKYSLYEIENPIARYQVCKIK